jgi:hypothetical protein
MMLPYFPLFSQMVRVPAVPIGYKGEDMSRETLALPSSCVQLGVLDGRERRWMDGEIQWHIGPNLSALAEHLEFVTSIDGFVENLRSILQGIRVNE